MGLLIVAIARSGPDTTMIGIVTTIEQHRVCVTEAGKEQRCAHVDYPGALDGIRVGDCVAMTLSGEGFLVEINPVEQCR
jgi:hypothetical protein